MTDNVAIPSDSYQIPPLPLGWSAPHWVRVGERVVVGGVSIDSGLFYLHTPPPKGRRSGATEDTESCVVDAYLEVAAMPQSAGEPESGKPRRSAPTDYRLMSPGQRRGFLEWMAAGRTEGAASTSYSLTFLAGIERRVFADLRGKVSHQEGAELVLALQSLIAQYGRRSDELFSHAKVLEDVVSALSAVAHPLDKPRAQELFAKRLTDQGVSKVHTFPSWQPPVGYMLALSSAAESQSLVTAEMALLLALMNPQVRIDGAAHLHTAEFLRLFGIRYNKKFAGGVVLPIEPCVEKFSYFSAASSLDKAGQGPRYDLDLRLAHPSNKKSHFLSQLKELAEAAGNDLIPYAYHCGDEDSKGSHPLSQSLILPRELWFPRAKRGLKTLQLDVELRGTLPMRYAQLLERLGAVSLPTDVQFDGVVAGLAASGLGLEANWRSVSHPKLYDDSTTIAVFADSHPELEFFDAEQYQLGACTLDAVAIICEAVGAGTTALHESLQAALLRLGVLELSLLKRLQVRACLPDAAVELPRFKATAREFSETQRQLLAATACACAASLPGTRAQPLGVLRKVYAALGLPADQANSDLGAASAQRLALLRDRPVQLDQQRIRDLHLESERTRAFLAPIFENADVAADLSAADAPRPSRLTVSRDGPWAQLQLDDDHFAFFLELATRMRWSRPELVTLSKSYGLMLDGALETLNDAGLDAWDEELFEGYDPVEATVEAQHRFAGATGCSL